ncbi:MAG: hypothetical protein WCQ95_09740 [Bacteroidota bacterium]
MNLHRSILKCKSRFYYYTLVILGSSSLLLFSRCANPTAKDNTTRLNDSIAQATHIHDSIAQADSLAEVKKQQWLSDSLAQADSLTKAKKKIRSKPTPNQFVPVQPIVDYGIMPNEFPGTKYGIPRNNYKN